MSKPDLIAEAEQWTYLGDGLYAKLDQFGQLALATHDGYRTLDAVYLDYDTLIALASFLHPRTSTNFKTAFTDQLTGQEKASW